MDNLILSSTTQVRYSDGMVQSTAQNPSQTTSQQNNTDATSRSREYLEQLRARRAAKHSSVQGSSTGNPKNEPAQLNTSINSPEPELSAFQKTSVQNNQVSNYQPKEVPQIKAPPPPKESLPPIESNQQNGDAFERVQAPPPMQSSAFYQENIQSNPDSTQNAGQPTKQTPPGPLSESEVFPGQYRPLPEEVVYEWKAASRPFKKRNRQFYTTVGLITLLVSLILFFAGQLLPIAVVISVAFLGYVMSSVPPDMITNKITTYGIRNDTVLYYWDELGRFWFEEKLGQNTLQVETIRFPGRITLVVNNEQQQAADQLLSEVLLNQKPEETFIDKSAKWLQDKIPLET